MANLSSQTRQEQILQALTHAEGRWIDGSELATETVGGSEGLRRLRELVADGVAIEKRRHPDPRRDVWQYRINPKLEPAPGMADHKFRTLPAKITFGEVAVCPRCRAKTRKYDYDGLPGLRHKDPYESKKPCLGCNGFGFVPNQGPIPMTAPEQMR